MGFYVLKPDQMQVINPLLILVFIPLYEVAFYPLLNLIGVRRPLQKLTLGGIFAGFAFIMSAVVEINLEPTYAVLPQWGSSQLRLYNGRNCDYVLNTNIVEHPVIELKSMEMFQDLYIPVSHGLQSYNYTITSSNCPNDDSSGIIPLHERTATSFFLNGIDALEIEMFEDSPAKSRRGWPFITVLANLRSATSRVRFVENGNERYNELGNFTEQVDIPAGWYNVFVDDVVLESNKELRLGGVYTVIVSQSAATPQSKLFIITQPNSVNMLWLLPQYVTMTLGEVSYIAIS